MFDNMVSDLEASKKSSPIVNELKNHQRFACFYITILFESAWDYTKEPFSFLENNTTLSLRFMKSLLRNDF